MNSDIIQRQIDLVNYGAAQKQFNISDAVNFFVPTPPIDKQEQLARFLDEQAKTLFLQVERIEKSLVLLREYRQALITAAVTGQLDIPAEAA
jgi:type I restriction enzyme S subunit